MPDYPQVPVSRLAENDLIMLGERTARVIKTYTPMFKDNVVELTFFVDLESGVEKEDVKADSLIPVLSYS